MRLISAISNPPSIVTDFSQWLNGWIESHFEVHPKLITLIEVVLFLFIGWVLWKVSRFAFKKIFGMVAMRTRSKWDDALVHNRFFKRLAQFIPGLLAWWIIPDFFSKSVTAHLFLSQVVAIYLILVGVMVLFALVNAVRDLLEERPVLNDKPIRSYTQLVKLSIALIALVYIIASLFQIQPLNILTGLGAVTAVILLLFKDTILGLVASVQMSSIDLVRKGDWITMEKYGADGDVVEINLTSIKVQNWDKTITIIPAYALVSESFKNWRGMQTSGGRRIKRKIDIKSSSIKFVDDTFKERMKGFALLKDYMSTTQQEIDKHNQENGFKPQTLDARRMTNIGIFRAYAYAYLRVHPDINQEMTCMVRQLEPSGTGLPLEVYAFSKQKEWEIYETILADIFDHLISAVPYFDLELYQEPTGSDFRSLSQPIRD